MTLTTEELQSDGVPSARVSYVNDQYPSLLRNNRLGAGDLARMRDEVPEFGHRPRMTLALPAHDDPLHLERTLDSVLSQIYPDWELYVVCPTATEEAVLETVSRYERVDERIQAAHIERDDGVCERLNEALSRASGEFVGFMDAGDELAPEALFEVVRLLQRRPDADLIYTDEDRIDGRGNRSDPYFKPGWSPDLLLSTDYLSRLSIYRKDLLEEIGGFRQEYEAARDYDLALRFTEQTDEVHRVPKVLYHRRTSPRSRNDESRRALSEALDRRGMKGSVEEGLSPGCFRVKPEIKGDPKVSIIMPTGGNVPILTRCIESIESQTTYSNYEIVVVDNSRGLAVDYLSSIPHRVVTFGGAFNYSRINNIGVSQAEGEYVLLLNDDTEVISGDWIEAMLEHAQRPEVGGVGAKLIYPDGRIQHAGVVTGIGNSWGYSIASPVHVGYAADARGYKDALNTIRNYSAVTAACMMLRKSVYEEVGGFDEENLPVAFQDVDLCLDIRDRGYSIVYTPYAALYHHEHVSKGKLAPDEEKLYLRNRWGKVLYSDPYYHPNFSTGSGDFDLRSDLLRPKMLRMEGDQEGVGPRHNKRGSYKTALRPREGQKQEALDGSR